MPERLAEPDGRRGSARGRRAARCGSACGSARARAGAGLRSPAPARLGRPDAPPAPSIPEAALFPAPDPAASPSPADVAPHDPLPGVPVVVLGLMGAGKTTLASRLAQRWGRPLRDSDADLRAQTGATAAELAEREGKDGLHAREAEHLLTSLQGTLSVVAAAASTVERPACLQALAAPFVIWLEADPRRLAARQGTGSHRPRYESDVTHMLVEMDRRRRPLFLQISDLVVHLGSVRAEPDDAVRERQKQALADAVAEQVARLAAEPGGRGELDADAVLDAVR
ncbi:MAG: shikimate kinase [Kineosporiaceae bacterium]